MRGKIIFITMLLLFISGCTIKNDNSISINRNGEVNYDILITFEKSFVVDIMNASQNSNYTIEDTDEIISYIEKNIKASYLDGLDKENYIDDDYIGIKYKYYIDDIDKISSNETNYINIGNYNSKDKLINKKLFTKNGDTYEANLTYELNDINIKHESYLIVNLPSPAIYNNANISSNNKRILKWNLTNTKNNINFKFRLKDKRVNISILSIIFDLIVLCSMIYIYKNEVKS